MSFSGETAYITGGASGIARYLAKDLASKGMKVAVADRNLEGAEELVKELKSSGHEAIAVQIDVADWESQKQGFQAALNAFGRIDYVFPVAGITERPWIPFEASTDDFVKPDLSVLDVNATGALYTTGLAVQHFQKQDPNKYGFRGKVVIVASACGFYNIRSLPIYTASKHAVVGFTRTYGKLSPEQQITINAICPTIVKTGISVGEFYDRAEAKGLLVRVERLLEGLEDLLGDCPTSGEAIELLPGEGGARIKETAPFTNEQCKESVEMTEVRTYDAFKALREKALQKDS